MQWWTHGSEWFKMRIQQVFHWTRPLYSSRRVHHSIMSAYCFSGCRNKVRKNRRGTAKSWGIQWKNKNTQCLASCVLNSKQVKRIISPIYWKNFGPTDTWNTGQNWNLLAFLQVSLHGVYTIQPPRLEIWKSKNKHKSGKAKTKALKQCGVEGIAVIYFMPFIIHICE